MEHIKKRIGENLYNVRNQSSLTLQQLSDITSVSKTMLSGIEKGDMNPSITTLWKIADGLKIPVGWLLNEKKTSVNLVREAECKPSIAGNGYEVLSIFPFDPEKHLEVYINHLEPDNILESDGHREGVVEYLMVFDGSIEITIDETMYQLHKGDSMKFAADSKHSYKCISKEIAKAYTVIYYEEKK